MEYLINHEKSFLLGRLPDARNSVFSSFSNIFFCFHNSIKFQYLYNLLCIPVAGGGGVVGCYTHAWIVDKTST